LGYRDWAESCRQTGQRNCTPRGIDLQLLCQGYDPALGSRVDCHVTNETNAGLNTHSPAFDTSDSIRYYHVLLVGVVSFLIGAITSFVILIHCCQSRITPAEHKPPATTAAADAVTMATAEKRRRGRNVMVTSRERRGVATLETTVIRRSSIDDKINSRMMMTTTDGSISNDVFSATRPACNGSSRSGLLNLTQYYRRHYTDGVADRTYCRT